jgi:hypothetical protein
MVVLSALMRRGPSVLSAAVSLCSREIGGRSESRMMPPICLNETSLFAILLTSVVCAENGVAIPQASGLDSAQDSTGAIISAVTVFHHRWV